MPRRQSTPASLSPRSVRYLRTARRRCFWVQSALCRDQVPVSGNMQGTHGKKLTEESAPCHDGPQAVPPLVRPLAEDTRLRRNVLDQCSCRESRIRRHESTNGAQLGPTLVHQTLGAWLSPARLQWAPPASQNSTTFIEHSNLPISKHRVLPSAVLALGSLLLEGPHSVFVLLPQPNLLCSQENEHTASRIHYVGTEKTSCIPSKNKLAGQPILLPGCTCSGSNTPKTGTGHVPYHRQPRQQCLHRRAHGCWIP